MGSALGMSSQRQGKALVPWFAVYIADSDSESGALVTSGERFVHSPADRQANEGSSCEHVRRADDSSSTQLWDWWNELRCTVGFHPDFLLESQNLEKKRET